MTKLARVATATLTVLLLGGAGPTAGAGPGGTTCTKLSGDRRASAPGTRIVAQPRRSGAFRGTAYVGCVLPAGPPRLLGRRGAVSEGGRVYNLTYSRGKVAGRYAVVRETRSSEGGSFERRQKVVDLGTGATRRFFFAEFAYEGGTPECDTPLFEPAPKQLVLGTNGILAGVFVPQTGDCAAEPDTTIVKVSVPGRPPATVDRGPVKDIPATSLRLDGRTVRWTHAGQPRRFEG